LKYIESKNNIVFKNIKKLLSKAKNRKDSQSFIVEGIKEIKICFDANYEFIELFVCSEILSKENLIFTNKISSNINTTDLSLSLYNQLSYQEKGEGLLALVKSKGFDLKNLILPKNPFILVAESPEKPGNIGAILRTADAAGIDAVIIANPRTELFNPNVIRSSLGSVFTAQIATGTSNEVIDFLLKNKINIYSTFIKKSIDFTSVNYKGPCAIVVGTESSSLTNEWALKSTKLIKIPMNGKMDSLNLSVSAAIVIFEALKQRNVN
jgi:RNA methyltransferase, TrmH family|tara:strand:+ start:40922 stop:41719 length:798 start_codon:yes stop_codon:yes gene_type:complete